MLELPGQAALSDFRLAKLTRSLQRADERVASVEACFTYFVSTHADLSREERARLEALLLSGEKPGGRGRGGKALYVVPRPGTISPWSSKATDIVRACGITAVERVERGIRYVIRFSGKTGAANAFALDHLLFDRMTEAVFEDAAGVEALFAEHDPVPVGTIPLGEQGQARSPDQPGAQRKTNRRQHPASGLHHPNEAEERHRGSGQHHHQQRGGEALRDALAEQQQRDPG